VQEADDHLKSGECSPFICGDCHAFITIKWWWWRWWHYICRHKWQDYSRGNTCGPLTWAKVGWSLEFAPGQCAGLLQCLGLTLTYPKTYQVAYWCFSNSICLAIAKSICLKSCIWLCL